ncbi:MAG TPA: multicopper oxidase domain-containing protein [Mycobacteriales bacterium]|nr:multicopper oxidase domain-containing protein [Mycobacteriales bacterium]
MARAWRRRALLAGVAALAAAGYAAAPLASAAPQRPALVLGHVPTDPTPLTGAVVAGPGGAVSGYYTKVVVITQGMPLTFVNLDELAHTVTSVAKDASGAPLFNGNALPGTTSTIRGADKLAPGTYSFYCSFHPNMQGTLIVEGSGSKGRKPAKPTFDSPLRLPPVLTGAHLTIPVREADVRVLPHGPRTLMWTYGGSYPGPTIRRPVGRRTTVTFVNKLGSAVGAITVHLHGDHHSSADDGQPDSQLIKPGRRKTYTYPLTDGGKPERAAFDFYHDHRMDLTGRNVWNGLQGMFITTDPAERRLRLPSGRYDVPLLVSDRSFDSDNQLEEPFHHKGDGYDNTQSKFTGPYAAPGDATVGDHILVNGVYAPHFNVGTHRYRLRLLNGSGFQSYDFKLSDGRPFLQVGTGSGLLPKPVRRTDILLGPAQRADVVVDFRKELGKRVQLVSVPRTDNQPGGIGTPDAPIMQFRVTKRVGDATRVPPRLDPLPKLSPPATPDAVWTFGLGGDATTGTFWTVNGHPYDPTRVDYEVPLGATQTWLLQNLSPITHFIHLHEEQWRTISRDGQPPAPYEAGLQDTWRLDPGETVEVAAKFTDYPGVFMVHCHMLDHEDHGMMAQFAVVRHKGDPLPAGYHFGPSTSAPVSMDMGGAAVKAMAQMASMRPLAAVPGWARTVTRAAWALAVELPALALLLVLGTPRRRRRTASAAAQPVASRITRVGFVLLLAGVAATHAADLLDKLLEAPYLAVGFGGLIVGSGLAALVLATAASRKRAALVERSAAVVAALTITGYVASRSIGLPQIPDHVGHWADPWGTASLVVETALVLLAARARLAGVRLPRVRVRTWKGVNMSRPRWVVALVAAVGMIAGITAAVPSEAAKPRVLLVCNGTKSCPHTGAPYYRSLSLAVSHARNGDWILVWPGTYKESVTVQPGHGLTSGLHIRGMNRNSVVFDGKKSGGSAVHVQGVNNTWVENMTGQNYLTGSANAFYWTGVDGYWGNYLTAYNNGDYGLYAYDSTSSGKLPSTFAHDYASWNADSGIYIGGCRDCHAVIVDSKSEKNALGYSGTNAGGELYLMESEWDHNATGILPNTLTSEPDPPQDGAFIVNNYVHDNNDNDVPGSGITAIAPVGYGIGIAGGSDNIVRGNLVTHQKHNGVGLFWLFTPPVNNQIIGNTFVRVGSGGPGEADIAFDGTSLHNCAQNNVDKTGGHTKPASTDPPNLGNLQDCGDTNPLRQLGRGLYEPGDPLFSLVTALNAAGITEPKDFKGAGPRPGAKRTMPNPCKGVPANPWCSRGRPRFHIPG